MVTVSDGVTTTSKVEDNGKSLKYPNHCRYSDGLTASRKLGLLFDVLGHLFCVYVCECNMNLILISHISVIDILYKLLFDLKYHINILNLFNL